MKVSAGTRGTSFSSGRQVTFTVTGMNNNDYSRTADMVMNVPYTRMNETMRMVQRMGGKITGIAVNGGDSGSAPAPARKKTVRKVAKEAPANDEAPQGLIPLGSRPQSPQSGAFLMVRCPGFAASEDLSPTGAIPAVTVCNGALIQDPLPPKIGGSC